MTSRETPQRSRSFDGLRTHIDTDPGRRARVDEHKPAMLAELRRELDLTQAAIAERLDVTQENVSQIERGEADIRLSTLQRYVEALGGGLEVRAAFPERTVELQIGRQDARRRRPRPARPSQA